MDFKGIILAILVTSAMLASISLIIGKTSPELNDKYIAELMVNQTGSNIYKTAEEFTLNIQNAVKEATVADASFVWSAVKGIWSAILLTFQSLSLYTIIAMNFGNLLGLGDNNPWVLLVTMFMTLTIVAMIIYAVARWKVQD